MRVWIKNNLRYFIYSVLLILLATGGGYIFRFFYVQEINAVARVEKNNPWYDIGVELPENYIEVEADARLLSQVFTNLLDNAIRHTPAGAEIKLVIREKEDNMVEIRVLCKLREWSEMPVIIVLARELMARIRVALRHYYRTNGPKQKHSVICAICSIHTYLFYSYGHRPDSACSLQTGKHTAALTGISHRQGESHRHLIRFQETSHTAHTLFPILESERNTKGSVRRKRYGSKIARAV